MVKIGGAGKVLIMNGIILDVYTVDKMNEVMVSSYSLGVRRILKVFIHFYILSKELTKSYFACSGKFIG